MTKKFYLQPDDIKRLIDDDHMCLATDRIVVDGSPVGYLYREIPSEEADSGWRFMAGDETDEYMGDANNSGVYALNTLANYDPTILELLEAPHGSVFAREPGDEVFTQLPPLGGDAHPVDEAEIEAQLEAYPDLHPRYPVVEGDYQLTAHWALTLPQPCNRRFEDGSMVLWRPGFTVHVVAWDNTTNASIAERMEQLDASVSLDATDRQDFENPDMRRVTYRLVEDGQASLNAFVVSAPAQLLASMYFDDDDGEALAKQVAESLRSVNPGEGAS